MKTSTTSLRSKSLVLLLGLVPALASAALVGKVHEIKGEAFMVHAGKTSVLTEGADIEEGADILVSDDAAVTVGDFFDRRHHLSAGSHLTMNDRAVVLKKGAVWTQSVGAKSTGQVTTANMLVQAEQGEWVTTYDVANRRTQLTAINGEVRVASPQEPAFQYAVSAGMFTLADPKVADGYPRSPTKLGYESLMKTLAVFPGKKSRDAGVAKFQDSAPARGIASVQEESLSVAKRGEITFIGGTASRMPASTDGAAQKYFVKKAKAKKKAGNLTSVGAATSAPVRVLGAASLRTYSLRKPASVRPVQSPKPSESLDEKSDDFLRSFVEQSKAQPKNPAEVQRLIDDLQSY